MNRKKIPIIFSVFFILLCSIVVVQAFAQGTKEYYQQEWLAEQQQKQFDVNNYEIGGDGTKTCPDIEKKHGMIIIKYIPEYEESCDSMISFYDVVQHYDIISIDESEISGITTVKLSK